MLNCTRTKQNLTKGEAGALLKKLAKLRKDGNQNRKEKRAYYCEVCKAWHLTAEPLPEPPEELNLTLKEEFKKFIG